jgi:hypothetical protein
MQERCQEFLGFVFACTSIDLNLKFYIKISVFKDILPKFGFEVNS